MDEIIVVILLTIIGILVFICYNLFESNVSLTKRADILAEYNKEKEERIRQYRNMFHLLLKEGRFKPSTMMRINTWSEYREDELNLLEGNEENDYEKWIKENIES